MAEPQEPIDKLAVRLAWIGVEDVPIVFVNQILGQIDDRGDAIITLGQASPPVLLGTPEEQQQQAAAVQFVQVRPVARVSLSPTRLQELLTVLRQTLDNQLKYQQENKAT